MARHRNVRTMNYDEEYDGYDDVYGHSVEDDIAASPSTQHFLYDRNQSHQMSAYMATHVPSDIPEEDEIDEDLGTMVKNVSGTHLKLPSMDDIEKAKLFSCLDILRDRMGDVLIEQEAIDVILKANFDVEKVLDQLLGKSVVTSEPIRVTPMTAVKGAFLPPTQDITTKTVKSQISLSQLAKLHLSKASLPAMPQKQLHMSNNVPILSKTLPSVIRPNLAQLATLTLGDPDSVKTTSMSAHPTISELPRVNLKSKVLGNFISYPSSMVRQPVFANTSSSQTSLNLASALRNKCSITISKDRQTQSSSKLSKDADFYLPVVLNRPITIDQDLLRTDSSSLGRVLIKIRPTSSTVFLKYNNRKSSNSFESLATTVKPFDFTSPSPDDAIKSRLRMT